MHLPCVFHAQSAVQTQLKVSYSSSIHPLQRSRQPYCDACKASATPAQVVPTSITRRIALWGTTLAGCSLQAASKAALAAEEILHVSSSGAYSSIGKAVSDASEGATIRVASGMYIERLVISKRVRIVADASGPVTLAWSTDQPYQSAIESQGLHGASVSGLTIRHRSPSVANNYAVFLQGTDLSLQDCDISSSTGTGVGIEGGSPLIGRCVVHNCERHGIAIFSELGGSEGGGSIQDCRVFANKLNGILVGDGADPALSGNDVRQNGASGISLKGCAGRYEGNSVASNGRGSVTVDKLADVDVRTLESSNQLDKSVTRL